MSTIPARPVRRNDYPTSDGKPMAETDWHRDLMNQLITTLQRHFAAQRRVYVSGNLLLFYEKGNRRHVSPDVFVVRGVPNHQRPNYLLWEEGRAPQFVIEVTSSSTRNEDVRTKRALYQDVLKVREYFLFDPDADYLDPPLQGNRLGKAGYRPIPAVDGRLPSQVIGLHLERAGRALRLWSPETGARAPTPEEAERTRADEERRRAEAAERRAADLEAQLERLRRDPRLKDEGA
jgi:Uma2 family endonuclease